LNKLASDSRFDGLFDKPGYANIEPLFKNHESLVLEYWNAWDLSSLPTDEDLVKAFRESQEAAVALLVATVRPGTHSYNFFLVHVLTTSHAVRILLPIVPAKFHLSLVRQWWLLALAVYIAVLRPKIDPDYVPPAKGRDWRFAEQRALNSEWKTDAHFVKGELSWLLVSVVNDIADLIDTAIRAMREAAKTWGDVHEKYLAAAVRFAEDFEGWVH
jgi:hypothetical protein